MLVKCNCSYIVEGDRFNNIIKAINNNIMKIEETEKPGRNIRRNVIIKMLVLKLYGMILWKFDMKNKRDVYSALIEQMVNYLYKFLRYEGDTSKKDDDDEGFLSKNESNLLLYTAIFQLIKGSRKQYIYIYIFIII